MIKNDFKRVMYELYWSKRSDAYHHTEYATGHLVMNKIKSNVRDQVWERINIQIANRVFSHVND